MQAITSTSNERIKFLKTLKSKKGRESTKTYLIEGKRAVLDAMAHGVKFECVLAEEAFLSDIAADCEIICVSHRVIEALSETSSPEGIIAQAKMFDTSFSANELSGITIFLDKLQDAGNLGTIIRTADAAGASAVILSPGCVELFNPKTVRATMSSIFNVRVMIADDSIMALTELKKQGYTVLAAVLGGEDFYSSDFAQNEKNCVIIGNEGNGISAPVLDIADKKISLPMRGGAESLNASVAAGILIYGLTFEK